MQSTLHGNAVIIQGSSRSNGDTASFVQHLTSGYEIDIIDLRNHRIKHFDYEMKNQDDDYLSLITRLIDNYENWIFATPVYWYSMSGIMKVFFDRISDLITAHKELGRKLRGKSIAVMSVSNENDVSPDFYEVFRRSAEYLGMHYLCHCHAYGNSSHIIPEVITILDEFRRQISPQKLSR